MKSVYDYNISLVLVVWVRAPAATQLNNSGSKDSAVPSRGHWADVQPALPPLLKPPPSPASLLLSQRQKSHQVSQGKRVSELE